MPRHEGIARIDADEMRDGEDQDAEESCDHHLIGKGFVVLYVDKDDEADDEYDTDDIPDIVDDESERCHHCQL